MPSAFLITSNMKSQIVQCNLQFPCVFLVSIYCIESKRVLKYITGRRNYLWRHICIWHVMLQFNFYSMKPLHVLYILYNLGVLIIFNCCSRTQMYNTKTPLNFQPYDYQYMSYLRIKIYCHALGYLSTKTTFTDYVLLFPYKGTFFDNNCNLFFPCCTYVII